MLCGQEYYIKATQIINAKMDEFCLNDSYNNGIIASTYDIVRMDNNGQIYISAPACAYYYGKYFSELFNSMINIETGKKEQHKHSSTEKVFYSSNNPAQKKNVPMPGGPAAIVAVAISAVGAGIKLAKKISEGRAANKVKDLDYSIRNSGNNPYDKK